MAIGQYIELWSLIAKHGAHAQPRRHSFGNGPRTSATRRRRRTGPSFLVNAPSHVPSNYATEQLQSPPRCKFFIWSVLLGRCWTPHRLQQHGLQNSGPCALCLQMSETIHHLLLTCVFSKKSMVQATTAGWISGSHPWAGLLPRRVDRISETCPQRLAQGV